MVAREFFIGPRVDPNRTVAPGARNIDSHQFRSGNRRLPGNLVAKINRLTNGRSERKQDKDRGLPEPLTIHENLIVAQGRPGSSPEWPPHWPERLLAGSPVRLHKTISGSLWERPSESTPPSG